MRAIILSIVIMGIFVNAEVRGDGELREDRCASACAAWSECLDAAKAVRTLGQLMSRLDPALLDPEHKSSFSTRGRNELIALCCVLRTATDLDRGVMHELTRSALRRITWVRSHEALDLGAIKETSESRFYTACEDLELELTNWNSDCAPDIARSGSPSDSEISQLLSSPKEGSRCDGLYLIARLAPDRLKDLSVTMSGDSSLIVRSAFDVLARCLSGKPLPANERTPRGGYPTRRSPEETSPCQDLWYNLFRFRLHNIYLLSICKNDQNLPVSSIEDR